MGRGVGVKFERDFYVEKVRENEINGPLMKLGKNLYFVMRIRNQKSPYVNILGGNV